ncbi:MAG: hypothetical protein E6K98_05000 [Thaumarchaeota archaeon]|nr:MAG: hypothetical protein E6K98_05000 [Nitrososphaerota archaeon]TLX94173.1 MAG: hypothetical protein E6K91_07160 [Nitrososphaerota archaeon]
MSNDGVQKALVCLAIESTLIKIGKPIYDKVIHDLNEKYHCYLTDCYEHPEYLNEVLKGLYGNVHDVIVESIKKQLVEFSTKKQIERFLKVLSQ